MKIKGEFLRVAGAMLIAATLTACASPAPAIQTGPGAETTFDGLVAVDNTALSKVWVRPGIDLNGYTKVLPVITGVQYAAAREYNGNMSLRSSEKNFPMSDAEKERFEAAVNEIFLEEFAKSTKFELTDQPGDDVLLIRVEILDVASMVPPESPGQRIYVRSVGEAGLVLEVYDSREKQILARAADRRDFSFPGDQIRMTSRGLSQSQVRTGLRGWARVLVKGLDSMKN